VNLKIILLLVMGPNADCVAVNKNCRRDSSLVSIDFLLILLVDNIPVRPVS